VPAEALEQQRAALRAEASSSGKPAAIVDRMVEGRLGKYYAEAVLADQPYVLSEEGAPVRKVLEEARKKLGLTTLRVAGLVRTKVGDAAKAADAAAEAAAAAAGGAAAPLA
jgi:elongation factor Ts